MNDDDQKRQNSSESEHRIDEPEKSSLSRGSKEDTAFSQPDSEGEQSVSGTMPDPESDDDTLANAHAAGTQLDEDEEHPKRAGFGSDIDKAEAFHREN